MGSFFMRRPAAGLLFSCMRCGAQGRAAGARTRIRLAQKRGSIFIMSGRQTDLTQGSILPQLVKYATPLVISSLLQAVYSLVDMFVVGRYVGPAGISGVNNAGMVTHMVTQVIIGLTTGGNILIGQYYGSGDRENCKKTTVSLFSLSMILGVLLAAVFFACSEPFLVALGAPSLRDAQDYLSICSIGLLFVAGYNGLCSALRAVGNSRQPLMFIAVSSVLNIALDFAFVAGLRMGTAGAALATVLSQGVSFILALVYVLGQKDIFGLSLNKIYIERDKLKMMLRLGIPCAVQWSVASISWLVVTKLINQYGVSVSAGNGVSIKIKDFCQLFISAMSSAAAVMIAQNIGATQYDRAKKVMYTGMKITLGMAFILILLVEVFAPQLAAAFSGDEAVIQAAVRNLRIEIIGQIFYASFFLYHSLALGAGHTWYVFFSSFVNCILFRLVLANIFERVWGLDGIYLACMIAPFTSIPLGYFYTRSGIWRRTLVGGKKDAAPAETA